MTMPIYPEWFIDGPWHGEDKRKKCPHLQGIIRCALPRPFNARMLLSSELTATDVMEDLAYDEYMYIPKSVDILGERITVWVSEQNAGMTSLGRYPDWVAMLGQIVMSPHRLNEAYEPFDTRPISQRHRERWDIEHEIRREFHGDLRAAAVRIRQLEEDLRRARTRNVLDTQIGKPLHELTSAAFIDLRDDEGNRAQIKFTNIVLYFDEGDGTDESPPSWVATAQGPMTSGDHSPPCTGYGTSKKAAIVALLADGLGVYARMIEFGERMK